MGTECSHNCDNCSQTCSDRKENTDFSVPCNAMSHIKNVIGIVSGKGGVGKSLVTALLACAMKKKGFETAVLDADITGPSIPRAFGITSGAQSCEDGILPALTDSGIKVMSLNLLTENETDPVVWRGPIIAGTVKQFWTDVLWGDVDYMFVDMPPGTGDVPLTVFQSLPIRGIIVVTSPQELVSMIVEKAANMARLMNIPILGFVENMSYYVCPECNTSHNIFGESKIDTIAAEYNVSVTGRLPLSDTLAALIDTGNAEKYNGHELDDIADALSDGKR